mgnify:CR=1 FL=1
MDVLKKVPVREQAPDVRNKKLKKKLQDVLIVRMPSVLQAVLYLLISLHLLRR